jgi:manganese transport protein
MERWIDPSIFKFSMSATKKKRIGSIGPAALVTAAFIGPGTVTTCTLAGAGYGYALLWALVFSVVATVVLQEMSARLGIVARKDLGEALYGEFRKGAGRWLSAILVISAIGIGNAAYETGNLLGGVLGLDALFGRLILFRDSSAEIRLWGPLLGIIAFFLLFMGSYQKLERILVVLVVLMSLVFLATMVMLRPPLNEILRGMFIPGIPAGAVFTVAGLVGTTVVPYNLFLHSAIVQEKWGGPEGLRPAKLDIRVSILLGGVVSMSIVATSAAAFFGTGREVRDATDLGLQLQPLLGNWATGFISTGLIAAGLTSAITAPLAAAYAVTGIMGWEKDLRSRRFRTIWMIVLGTGILLSALGLKPVPVIVFAQAANGILLPVIAIYLLRVMNNKDLLGVHSNRLWRNLAGGGVTLVAVFLGLKSLASVFGLF